MPEWCWLNGDVMPLADAKVSVEDRGFLFGDGVYEALRIYSGRPFGLEAHLDRLAKSCAGIELALPFEKPALAREILKLARRCEGGDALLYLQVTRGPSPRNHIYPKQPKPTVFFFIRPLAPLPPVGEGPPHTLLSVPDERWQRCWIKSIGLLANVIAKNRADRAGADEAIFIDNGIVTEGASSNLFMVIGRRLVTHPLGNKVLPGVTRELLLDCARAAGIPADESRVKLEDARRADEVFITSATREVAWVSKWDDTMIGNGSIGDVTRRLHAAYRERIAAEGV